MLLVAACFNQKLIYLFTKKLQYIAWIVWLSGVNMDSTWYVNNVHHKIDIMCFQTIQINMA